MFPVVLLAGSQLTLVSRDYSGAAAITVYWQHGVLEAPILPLVT
jgi:hypothetical protein